jgi:hypothetical protein
MESTRSPLKVLVILLSQRIMNAKKKKKKEGDMSKGHRSQLKWAPNDQL